MVMWSGQKTSGLSSLDKKHLGYGYTVWPENKWPQFSGQETSWLWLCGLARKQVVSVLWIRNILVMVMWSGQKTSGLSSLDKKHLGYGYVVWPENKWSQFSGQETSWLWLCGLARKQVVSVLWTRNILVMVMWSGQKTSGLSSLDKKHLGYGYVVWPENKWPQFSGQETSWLWLCGLARKQVVSVLWIRNILVMVMWSGQKTSGLSSLDKKHLGYGYVVWPENKWPQFSGQETHPCVDDL